MESSDEDPQFARKSKPAKKSSKKSTRGKILKLIHFLDDGDIDFVQTVYDIVINPINDTITDRTLRNPELSLEDDEVLGPNGVVVESPYMARGREKSAYVVQISQPEETPIAEDRDQIHVKIEKFDNGDYLLKMTFIIQVVGDDSENNAIGAWMEIANVGLPRIKKRIRRQIDEKLNNVVLNDKYILYFKDISMDSDVMYLQLQLNFQLVDEESIRIGGKKYKKAEERHEKEESKREIERKDRK